MLSNRLSPRLVNLVCVYSRTVSTSFSIGDRHLQSKSLTKIPAACFHCSSFLKAKLKLKRPVDDVYLENLYEPRSYKLDEVISILKKNAKLDFSDDNSLVHLNLELYLRPGKKGRLQPIQLVRDLPHPVDHENKICVFTEDSDEAKIALKSGAHMAGSTDIIPKILIEKELCDAYVASPAFVKSQIMPDKELMKKLGKLVPKRHRGLTDDVVATLLDFKDRTIISNLAGSGLHIKTLVAMIKQPFEEIKQNIIYVMEAVQKEQNSKHPPILVGGSVTCCHETIPFELEEENEEDLD